MSREESLMEKYDILEAELGELRLEKLTWDAQQRRLTRELEIKDDKLSDMGRDLRVSRDNEAKAVRRCEKWLKDVEELERQKGELMRSFEEENCLSVAKLGTLRDEVVELKRVLEDKEEKMVQLVRKNVELETDKAGFDTRLRGKEEEIEGLQKEKAKFGTRLGEVNESLKKEKAKLEAELGKMRRVLEEKEGKIKEFENVNGVLVKEKMELDAKLEEMRRVVEVLEEATAESDSRLGEKEEKIKELMKINEGLERARIEGSDELKKRIEGLENVLLESVKLKDGEIEVLLNEKRVLMEKVKQVEERFLNLEEDAINSLCLDVKIDKKFGSTHIGKIIARILDEIECEDGAVTGNGRVQKEEKEGNAEEADSAFVQHVNELKCSLESTMKSEEAVRRTLDIEEEYSRDNGATCNKKMPSTDVIDLDSDDDDNPLPLKSLKRKSGSPESLRERLNSDGSGDDRLNPKYKTKKFEHELCEPVKPSFAKPGYSGVYKLNDKCQTSSAIKKCQESVSQNLKPGAELEELIASTRKRSENKVLVDAAAMHYALDADPVFCAQAVCALYRWHKRLISRMSCSRSRGLEHCDVDRVTSLAKFLIDADPTCKGKKALDELRQHDPSGPDECKRFARQYYKELFEIFKNKEDLRFSPLSSDLQYTYCDETSSFEGKLCR